MNIPSLIILILLFISVCLICKNEIINKPLLLIPMLLVGLLVISIIKNDNVEHMTNEAISNCASLFNGGNGTVKDLTVTGEIKLPNGWKIRGNNDGLFINKGDTNGSDNQPHFVMSNDGNLWLSRSTARGWVADYIGDTRANYFKQGSEELKLSNNWKITSPNDLRIYDGGNQQTVIHRNNTGNGAWNNVMWNKGRIMSEEKDVVTYGQTISIHGRRGMLDNWANRCNSGDRDRDVGMGCSEGINSDVNWKWQIRKR
jgi:hypothetical protein